MRDPIQRIMTKYTIKVVEYDSSGYYYPRYATQQVVIAETLEEAEEKALERTPLQHSSSDWKQYTKVLGAEDIVVGGTANG